jgi:hypothetical protein
MHGLSQSLTGSHGRASLRTASGRPCAGGAYGSPQAAVLALQRMAGNRATRSLMRSPVLTEPAPAPGERAAPAAVEPTVTDGRDKDEIIVTRADGTKFHVRHRIRAQKLTRPGAPRVGFCHDDKRVFMRIAWCEGTQGTIDVGANPQGALKDVIDKALGQINNRAGVDQVIQTLENTTVKPFAEFEIASVGSWKVTGDVSVDVNRDGFGTPKAGVKADIGWVEVGVDVTGKDVNVTAKFPLGKHKVQGKDCPLQELAVWREFDCLRETPTTNTLKVPGEIKHNDKLFLYFDYAKDRLRSDPKSGTAQLNQIALDRLDSLLTRGFNVTAINGYTSPEGRRGPPGAKDKGAAKNWEGNDELSAERARAAKKLIEKRYALHARSGDVLGRPPPALGKTELPTLTKYVLAKDGPITEPWKRLTEVEVEGNELDAAIVGDFRENHPEETARLMPDDRAFIANASHGTRKRAERMFENLRRVEVILQRKEKLKDLPVHGYELNRDDECPQDVIDAAERKWGTRIPFTKAPPPLCS